MVITGLTGHWWPDRIVWPGLELAVGVVIVIALSLLGSVVLSSTANGIAVFMLFGAGLVAGLLGTIGHALNSHAIKHASTIAAWALPFEALYQDALRMITAERRPALTGFLLQLGPFGGAYVHGWGIRVWSVGYLARRRRRARALRVLAPEPLDACLATSTGTAAQRSRSRRLRDAAGTHCVRRLRPQRQRARAHGRPVWNARVEYGIRAVLDCARAPAAAPPILRRVPSSHTSRLSLFDHFDGDEAYRADLLPRSVAPRRRGRARGVLYREALALDGSRFAQAGLPRGR